MNHNPDFFPWELEEETNSLMQYLHEQPPETLERVAQAVSTEIKEIISQNVQGLLGMLPSGDFNIQITTDRENLANLLVSAMMTGYFLGQMEQRRNLESVLSQSDSLNPNSSKKHNLE